MKNSKRFSMVALIIAVCALLVMFAACQNGFDPENNELLTGELNFKLSDKTIVDGIDLIIPRLKKMKRKTLIMLLMKSVL